RGDHPSEVQLVMRDDRVAPGVVAVVLLQATAVVEQRLDLRPEDRARRRRAGAGARGEGPQHPGRPEATAPPAAACRTRGAAWRARSCGLPGTRCAPRR